MHAYIVVMQVLLTPNVTTEVSMWTVGPLYFKTEQPNILLLDLLLTLEDTKYL